MTRSQLSRNQAKGQTQFKAAASRKFRRISKQRLCSRRLRRDAPIPHRGFQPLGQPHRWSPIFQFEKQPFPGCQIPPAARVRPTRMLVFQSTTDQNSIGSSFLPITLPSEIQERRARFGLALSSSPRLHGQREYQRECLSFILELIKSSFGSFFLPTVHRALFAPPSEITEKTGSFFGLALSSSPRLHSPCHGFMANGVESHGKRP